MTKTIDTLVPDIYELVKARGGWDKVVNDAFKDRLGGTVYQRLGPRNDTDRKYARKTLRMSNIGTPCARKLWYDQHLRTKPSEDRGPLVLMFLFGDILEDLLLSLAEAAGHKVEGHQDEMHFGGLTGHRDAVIDGVNVDIKSASPSGFQKFKDHSLPEEDPYGYIVQLCSYVAASKEDPLVTDKTGGAFLVINKVTGELCLDYYDFAQEGTLSKLESIYEQRKEVIKHHEPPPRKYQDLPHQKSGNRKLGFECSYCDFNTVCWPGLRAFKDYRGKPIYLSVVKKEPRQEEINLG